MSDEGLTSMGEIAAEGREQYEQHEARIASQMTIDVAALRTMLDLAEQHDADWLRVSTTGVGFTVELDSDVNFEATNGLPLARYHVADQGGSQAVTS